MRAVLAVFLFLVTIVAPSTHAEFGPYDEDGWPINIEGESTNPDAENRVGPVTLYPYYPILTVELQRLATEYPDVVRLTSAGKSTIGLELWILEIADFSNPNMIPLAEREVVWVDGGTHSNEYSGVYFALAVAQYLIEGYGNDERATWIVENRQTWILPMVNPDGSNLMGRLNANLVNINRNYPVVWDGVGNDALMNNRGPSPASEVETQITIEWYNKTQPDYLASVHCCGILWLYPYGEEGVDPPQNDFSMFEKVCDLAMPDVRSSCGPIWSTIYPASGSSVDTAYEYTGAVAFGYEMSGRGAVGLWGQPFTLEEVAVQEYESWNGLMHAFENVHLYGAYPVITKSVTLGSSVEITVANIGYGNMTHLMAAIDDQTWVGGDMDPPLEPGQSIKLMVPGRTSEAQQLQLHYIKRDMSQPEGMRSFDLAAGELVDSMAPVGLETNPVDSPFGVASADPERTTPMPGLLALALLVGLLARRRK